MPIHPGLILILSILALAGLALFVGWYRSHCESQRRIREAHERRMLRLARAKEEKWGKDPG